MRVYSFHTDRTTLYPSWEEVERVELDGDEARNVPHCDW